MIRLSWQWIGQGPALDLADTMTVSVGEETDLLALPGEYERWAQHQAHSLGWPEDDLQTLLSGRDRILDARRQVRAVMAAAADGDPLPPTAVKALNGLSQAAPEWVELNLDDPELVTRTHARGTDALLARYARDALRWASGEAGPLRRCPAPSCGMFYPPRRPQQRWCSTACGTRARVARHHRTHQA